MKTYRRSSIVLGMSAALAFAACGGGTAATNGPGGPAATTAAKASAATQAAGGGATVDACSFLTPADIDAVTGNAIKATTPGMQSGIFMAGCGWELIDADAIVPPSITLGIMTTGGRTYYDTYFAPYNEENGNKPIAGLGEAAVDAGFGSVLVVSGDAFFNMQYLSDDTQNDLQVELARKVLTHLGG